MPQILRIGPYIVYFWSNENNPLEPVHVHIAEGKATANATKLWITSTGKVILCNNNSKISEKILRKGAIAAHKGEKVLIPINMRDGSILAVGKGNPEWNYSAPHGAGRVMSRKQAIRSLSMEDYRKAMERIYTTSENEGTLDEAPMAYKSMGEILDAVKESVEIIDIPKPKYNFKASEDENPFWKR